MSSQEKTPLETIFCFLKLTVQIVYRQLFYLLFSPLFFFKMEQIREPKKQPTSTLNTSQSKVDLSENQLYLKSTDVCIKFPLRSSIVVITDIIDSTRLYNENPLKMKDSMLLHYKMIGTLVKKHGGHIVSNEGDSFQLAFQHVDDATEFCEDFFSWHHKEVSFFQVRLCIVKGKHCVRKFCGYKVFGKAIDDALDFFRHNDGNHICVKKNFVTKNNLKLKSLYCVH